MSTNSDIAVWEISQNGLLLKLLCWVLYVCVCACVWLVRHRVWSEVCSKSHLLPLSPWPSVCACVCLCVFLSVCVCYPSGWSPLSLYKRQQHKPSGHELDKEERVKKYPELSNGEQGRLDKLCYNKVTVLPVMLMNQWIRLNSHSGCLCVCVLCKASGRVTTTDVSFHFLWKTQWKYWWCDAVVNI